VTVLGRPLCSVCGGDGVVVVYVYKTTSGGEIDRDPLCGNHTLAGKK
jgi:hypothetical protein